MDEQKLKDNIEVLEIKLHHLRNDYLITKEEYENSTKKYLELVSQLSEKNNELETLKSNLEILVEERTGELQESEENLRLKNEELQIILDSSPVLIYYKNRKNRFVRVNKSFADFFSLTFEELVKKKSADLFPEISEKQKNDEKKVIKTGKPKLNVIEEVATSNGARWLSIDKVPYKDSTGKIIGIIGFAFDITKGKETEEENKKLQDQLFQSQKLESIGRLAGGIAHDFNNILAVISGYSEILKISTKNLDPKMIKAVKAISDSSRRASKLTRQLLSFARRGRFNPVPLDLNKLISDTIKVSEKIFEKKVKVKYSLDDKIKSVEGDKNQITQVITNLVINAKDAMPEGGKIEIKTRTMKVTKKQLTEFPELHPGEYVQLSISDTGIGIKEEVKQRIFEPFFTTKKEGIGTGLGLATTYGIVRHHKGFIDFNTEIGEGTTFNIWLPSSEKVVEEVKRVEEVIRGNATILVVDDEKSIRALTKELLEDLGYTVFLAKDGFEALDVYLENKEDIDLVLLDMLMPRMDGRDTYYKLTEINPKIKVLIISGYIQDEKAYDVLNKGALGFIHKPYTVNEISRHLSNALKN
ncbi:MAG: response regulator [bacterium]|nr:response regulator [bacterium]